MRRRTKIKNKNIPNSHSAGGHAPLLCLEMNELHEIISAKYKNQYRIEVVFDDLTTGVLDLKKYVGGKGVFAPLKDPKVFTAFRVDADLGTIVWENGADISPDTLYADLKKQEKMTVV